MKVFLLTLAGFVFLACGAVGLLIPVWPTTPFVLVSAACFSGTPRLRAKIMSIGFFREHFENYARRVGLRRRTVTVSLGYLWGMLLLSAALVRRWEIILILAGVGVAVTIHLLCMARPKKKDQGAVAKRNGQDCSLQDVAQCSQNARNM